tara:strand:- start:4106 stop:4489 length:384 start_codon:yes stop_codon:yes gene_type:complete
METITMELSAEECKQIQSQREVKEQVITIKRQKKLLEVYESEIDFLKFQLEKLTTECQKRTKLWSNDKKKYVDYVKVNHKLMRTVINCWEDGHKTKEEIKNLDDIIEKCDDLVIENEKLEEWNGNMK